MLHHRHPGRQAHRLGLVVGDEDKGRAQAAVQIGEFVAHLDAQLRVQVGQRLVHQKSGRLAHHGARQRGTLALPARQLPRLALQQIAQTERAGQLDHFRVDARQAAAPARHQVADQRLTLEE